MAGKKYSLFFAVCLALYLSCSSVWSADPLPPLSPLGRFSSIEIKPCPQLVANNLAFADLPAGISKYKEEHGRGSLFDYRLPPPEELGSENESGTHKNILAKLNKYRNEEFDKNGNQDDKKRNALLARIKLLPEPNQKLEDDAAETTYWLGVFFSGNDDYGVGTLDDLLDKVSSGAPKVCAALPKGLENSLREKRKEAAKNLFFPEIIEYMCDIPSDTADDLKLKIFKKRPMRLNAQIVLPPCSSCDFFYKTGKGNSLIHTVRANTDRRLFGSLELAKSQNHGEYIQRLTHIEETSHVLFNMPYYNATAYSKGQYCYDNDTAEKCFVQSEPCFLSFLEDKCENDKACVKTTGGLVPDTKYRAIIDLFSYKDICIICRGTFSYMLKNAELQKTIKNFLNKTRSEDAPIGEITIGAVYAHSIYQTDF